MYSRIDPSNLTKELQRHPNRSNLLKLPRELRFIIIKFVLAEDTPITKRSLEIFLTCSTIRDDGYEVFYGSTTFKVASKRSEINWFTCKTIMSQAPLWHVKLYIGQNIKIVDVLKEFRCCERLISLAIIMDSVPSYKGSNKPEVLKSLKYEKLPNLRHITVEE